MPLDTSILKLSEYEIINITGINPVIYEARYTGKVNCPFCRGYDLRKKDKYIRRLNHETIGRRNPRTKVRGTYLKFKLRLTKILALLPFHIFDYYFFIYSYC